MPDPLGHFHGRPTVPPWAVRFGLHPPYPGGSFEEYLDPRSPHFRADVVAALDADRRRAEQERAAADEAEQRAAAFYRERFASIAATDDLVERARQVVEVGAMCASSLIWETWERIKAAGVFPPTHDLVRLKIGTPVFGPRFKELERRPAWQEHDRDRWLDEEDQVWVAEGGQPVRHGEPWFPVESGGELRATVMSASSTGRFTMISAKPLVRARGERERNHSGTAVGVLESFVAR
jgi:hypothetical protein